MLHEHLTLQSMKDTEAAIDMVNHPTHYKALGASCSMCQHPIECIDITRHMDFNLGNAIKYIWRSPYKSKSIQDLQKAIFYLQDRIKEIELKASQHVKI